MTRPIRSGALLAALALVATVALAPGLGALGTAPGPGAPAVAQAAAGGARHNRAVFHDTMRKLWEDHITWTRLFIVSFATLPDPLPDLGPTTDRLLANQVDIGDAVKPFYGEAAGNRLAALLREHILGAAQLLAAAKSGTPAEVKAASDAWYANAREIGAFLHAASPRHIALADIQAMMKTHLDLTLAEATAQLTGDYAGSVRAYDEVHSEILEMADTISSAIIAQFPAKFAHAHR